MKTLDNPGRMIDQNNVQWAYCHDRLFLVFITRSTRLEDSPGWHPTDIVDSQGSKEIEGDQLYWDGTDEVETSNPDQYQLSDRITASPTSACPHEDSGDYHNERLKWDEWTPV